MRMDKRKISIFLIFSSVVSLIIVGSLLDTQFLTNNVSSEQNNSDQPNKRDGVFTLTKPDALTTFLDDEAGIALYTDLQQPLDLTVAKSTLAVVTADTPDYVIGSISLPGLAQTDDVQSFVHKDGWIVIYYLKADPLSKIIDWNSYSGGVLSKTKLELGLDIMTLALISGFASSINYYHFNHPSANNAMLIIETEDYVGIAYNRNKTGIINLKLPSEFIFYERSWSHRKGADTETFHGTLTGLQLSVNTFHTIEAILYRPCCSTSYNSYFDLDGERISQSQNIESLQVRATEVGIGLVYYEP